MPLIGIRLKGLKMIARGKFVEGECRHGSRVPGAALRLRLRLPRAILFEPSGLAEHEIGGDPGIGSRIVGAKITMG